MTMAVMRCPICGAKMKYGICEYCKIRSDQVNKASNRAAKKAFRSGKGKENVFYSTTLPSDVSKLKLMLLTIFLGYAGGGYFYVGKYARAWSLVAAWIVTFIFEGTRLYYVGQGVVTGKLVDSISWVLTLICALSLVLWLSDIINLIFHKYSVPVVLADKNGVVHVEEEKEETVEITTVQPEKKEPTVIKKTDNKKANKKNKK